MSELVSTTISVVASSVMCHIATIYHKRIVRPAGWIDLGIVFVSRSNLQTPGNRASDIAKDNLVSRGSRGDPRLYVGLTWAIP